MNEAGSKDGAVRRSGAGLCPAPVERQSPEEQAEQHDPAYQAIPNADLVVKNQRLPERALPDVDVKWVKFDSGGDVRTAVIAGSVDLGPAGASPVTKGLSAPLNIPYKVVWIHDLIGDNEALVAKPGIGSGSRLVTSTLPSLVSSLSVGVHT
ncbi:hypothetical protein WDV06_03290 [Streptomyces racemochromogenes]|uniref:Uncharacterized protein n=1 Tax=Streptomyces racemochromogenes TaxID=67353 RepID=A0ABW7P708_9ACTN